MLQGPRAIFFRGFLWANNSDPNCIKTEPGTLELESKDFKKCAYHNSVINKWSRTKCIILSVCCFQNNLEKARFRKCLGFSTEFRGFFITIKTSLSSKIICWPNSPFHAIQQVVELFVKHKNFISKDCQTIPVMQSKLPYIDHTWHGKLLVAQSVTNCKTK